MQFVQVFRGNIFLSGRFSVRLCVRYQTCEENNLKTNELSLLQIGTSGPRGRARNDQHWGQQVISQGHTTSMSDLEPWRRHHSRSIRSSRFSSLFSVIIYVYVGIACHSRFVPYFYG